MPISDLFNPVSFNIGYNVSPLQLINSTDHNNLLNENRNKHLYAQSNADTATGGIGIESRYIANSAITSSKINLQAGKIFTANPFMSSASQIPWNQTWTSPNYGQFTINWEKPFMTCDIDTLALWSINHTVASNPIKMMFNGTTNLYAVENGTPVLVAGWATDEFFFKFKHIRDGYAQDNGASVSGDGVYQDVYSRPARTLYTSTTGQASTSFYFVSVIQNETRYLNASASQNYGTVGVRELIYTTYNQIHS